MKETGIEWTDSTWNPWHGCERVSPACAYCYADEIAKRWGFTRLWDGEFRFLGETNWRKPVAWNAEAEALRRPRFVFCASMADLFQDHEQLVEPRERVLELIGRTRWLVWLLLTKRPENIRRLTDWEQAPDNVWLGTSIENARHTYRVELLQEVDAPVHFLSCEPLLGSLFDNRGNRRALELDGIEWVIAGGESGRHLHPGHPRLLNLDHARELRDACRAGGIPYFLKQIGGRYPKAGGKALDGREWCERPTPKAPSAALTLF